MTDLKPVAPQALYSPCDPAGLDFETSDQQPPPDRIFGQVRAVDAVHLAASQGF